MSINIDWDVEQYRMECESDEHWELKRNFLLTHKDKYPEDTLVCLAQVFINIELLGCRYPKQTMDLIKELSQDVASEYREKQKKKLQRTFVEASQAASSKIKGYINRTSTEKYAPNCSKYISSTANQIDSSCKTVDTKKLSCNRMEKSVLKKNKFDEQSDTKEQKFKKSKTNDVMSYEDIILWERPGDTSQNILSTSANICNANLEWKYKKEEIWECTIYFNSNKLACCMNSNKKIAKSKAADTALKKLQKSYYTIKVKQNLDANVTVTTQEIKQTNVHNEERQKFDCIGEKMMKMMGWMGGGLGKSEQGVIKPMSMTLQSQVSRKGFGLIKTDSCTTYKVKTKCENVFKDFLESNMQNDIVFLDFTNDERVVIHQMARRMGLKSRSYGPRHQRKLIVSRKIDIQSLLNELKSLGGVTEKYELIEPTDKKLISSSCSIASTSNST